MAKDIGTPEYYSKKILSFEKNIEIFERRIEQCKEKIKELNLLKIESEKLYKQFKYKIGNAVFHTELGNCLIKSLTTKRFVKHYEIIDKNGNCSYIEESKLLPITEATQTLYNK